MGHTTTRINKIKAQTIISANPQAEIISASEPEMFTALSYLTMHSLAVMPTQVIWSLVESCELGDNKRLYMNLINQQFIEIQL